MDAIILADISMKLLNADTRLFSSSSQIYWLIFNYYFLRVNHLLLS